MDEDVQKDLWGVPKDEYGGDHSGHLLEQYKLYVEMADRISQRRQAANTFFLTINAAIGTMLGIVPPLAKVAIGGAGPVMICLGGIALCYVWHRLLRSYRDLNSGKFRVIHAIERHLPIRPYDAEWTSIGRGEKPELYLPFTHIETGIPWVFAGFYVGLAVFAVIG